ncbi:MAG TPA: GH92 family glycosyl hydrolase [Opitutaceae bacterium]|nr:GH92 family glycosyl hydrolase [Opitutaceae bacterium]
MRHLLPAAVTRAAVFVATAVALRAAPATPPLRDLTRYADPMCGTAGFANTFPGATAPFGMIQWSPDTEAGTKKGGYAATDKRISGFSLDHLSGAGCVYAENFSFMPVVGPVTKSPGSVRTAFAATFSHADETAKPGYYAVTLGSGIKVELTTTARSGFGRFTYPAGAPPTLTINGSSVVWGAAGSDVHIDPKLRAVSGSATGGHFCRCGGLGTVYFYAIFDRPFASWATWNGDALRTGSASADGAQTGAVLTFDPSGGRVVMVKVEMSYVSVENARLNAALENPASAFTSGDFDAAVTSAAGTWNRWLNRIELKGGTETERRTFYSMFYHALLGPTICSDANGEYLGFDGRVHTVEPGRVQYANFSGWDVYRSECQFLAMIAPKEAGDMAQSLLIDYQQSGAFPKWGIPGGDSGVMVGDPAAAMIADFHALGARDFEAKSALDALLRAATDPAVHAPRTKLYERDGLEDYLKLGYVAEETHGGSVGITLEYASADFGLSQFAGALGNQAAARLCLAHAQNWKNLFNPATGYIAARRKDGTWAPGWSDDVENYDGHRVYVEGTAAHYVWMVPFNLKGLADAMGGAEKASHRLDVFFTKLNAGDHSRYADLGNEPTLQTPWIYDFLGKPWKTQQIVRRAMTELFSDRYDAYPGNDDLGEMSSWYIFGALGMYPELPGSDVLVLGSPLFPEAIVHLAGGDLVIRGDGAGAGAPYVQRLKIDGREWSKPWLRFSTLSQGATIEYRLGPTPRTDWGADANDAPPSYGSPSN